MKLGRTDKQDTPLIPVTLRGRAVVWRSLADPIWASGHVAALTGRTHGRFRPAANLLAKPLNPRGRPHMVLRWRPAPVQATYLGFIGPVPLPELDYLLCDSFVVPPQSAVLYQPKP